MFDKLINKGNNCFFDIKIKKYCIWFKLEFDVEGKYNPRNSFNELVDCMKEYFRNSKDIYYEKKKLEVKINNSSTNIPLSQLWSNIITLLAIFFASIFSIITAIKYNNEALKNKNLLSWLSLILIFFIGLIVLTFIVYTLDLLLSSNSKSCFNLLCLGIIEDIEKEIEDEKATLKEEADKKEYWDNIEQCVGKKSIVNNVLRTMAETAVALTENNHKESKLDKLIRLIKKTSK